VTRGATEAQIAAWRILVRLLRARYDIAPERVYAHNWIRLQGRALLRRLRARDPGTAVGRVEAVSKRRPGERRDPYRVIYLFGAGC